MKSLHTWLQKTFWKFSKLLSKRIHFETTSNFFAITSTIRKHYSFSRPRTSKILLLSTELVLHCPTHKDTAECSSQFAFPSVNENIKCISADCLQGNKDTSPNEAFNPSGYHLTYNTTKYQVLLHQEQNRFSYIKIISDKVKLKTP